MCTFKNYKKVVKCITLKTSIDIITETIYFKIGFPGNHVFDKILVLNIWCLDLQVKII